MPMRFHKLVMDITQVIRLKLFLRLDESSILAARTVATAGDKSVTVQFETDHLPSIRVASPKQNRLQDKGDRSPIRTLDHASRPAY